MSTKKGAPTLFLTPLLDARATAVLERIDALRAQLGVHVREPARWTGLLRRNVFARAIQGSNTIEGYNVTTDDAIAAVEGEEPLEASQATWAEILGYRRAMTYVLQLARDPQFRYSVDQLKGMHYMLLEHELGKSPGHWRPGHIAVRNDATGRIVYEGPGAERVPELVEALIESLNSDGKTHTIVRGAMAHLNLTMIHPFRDGNGRMARVLQTLVLGRGGVLAPEFSSIEEYLGRNSLAYYDVLQIVGKGGWHPENDTTPWIHFCLTAHYRQARTVLNRVERIRRLWDEIEVMTTSRGLPERTILALADAAMGVRVRNPIYRKGADITPNLASRDLGWLVREGLLESHGEKKGRYYEAAPQLRRLVAGTETSNKTIEDPFEDPAPEA